MNTHRTVAWLAILMIITPFLAIPEWLMKTVLAVFGVAIVCTAWLARPDTASPSSQDTPDMSDSDDGSGSDDQSRNSEPASTTEDPQQQLDIEDPEADTMMAADRWRRRASRDIS